MQRWCSIETKKRRYRYNTHLLCETRDKKSYFKSSSSVFDLGYLFYSHFYRYFDPLRLWFFFFFFFFFLRREVVKTPFY